MWNSDKVRFVQHIYCQSEICSVGVLCKSFIALIFALSEDCLSLCCSHCLYFSVFSAKCLHESHYEFYNLQVSTPSRCLAGLFGLGLQLGLVSFCSLVVGHTNSTPWNRELNLQLVLWMQKRMHRSVSSWFKRQKKCMQCNYARVILVISLLDRSISFQGLGCAQCNNVKAPWWLVHVWIDCVHQQQRLLEILFKLPRIRILHTPQCLKCVSFLPKPTFKPK